MTWLMELAETTAKPVPIVASASFENTRGTGATAYPAKSERGQGRLLNRYPQQRLRQPVSSVEICLSHCNS